MSPTTRNWLLYAAAWLPPALLYGAAVAAQRTVEPAATLPEAIASGLFIMGAAAVLGVGVWRLSGRLPLVRGRGLRFIAAHFALAGAYAALWTGIQLGWLWLVAGRAVALGVYGEAGVWTLLTGVWVYGVVAGISYFVRARSRLREREVAAARAEAAAARAQLQVVRGQLDPHFLYNALHGLGALLRRDVDRAEQALDRLGQILRYALDQRENDLVTLADEWDFTHSYLELERLRLGERLRVHAELDDDALDTLVPPFVLQPLLENAVRHAAAARAHGATIRVHAGRAGAELVIEVSDDGPGADPRDAERASGVGLRALRQQLAERYAGRACVDLRTAPGAGFHVRIALPAEPAPEPAHAGNAP